MTRLPFALLSALLAPVVAAQDLVPAGTINGAIDKQNAVFVVQDEPAIAKYAEQIRARIFGKCGSLRDADAKEQDLAGSNLLVYGTPAHAWLQRQRRGCRSGSVNGA
jgi:hypothetical protein